MMNRNLLGIFSFLFLLTSTAYLKAEGPLSAPTTEVEETQAPQEAPTAPKETSTPKRIHTATELEPEIKELVASSPSPSDLPEDAAIFLLREENDYVEEDGRATITRHDVVKILKESAKSLSQITLSYNQSYEELKIETARTIKPDGRVIKIDPTLVQDAAILAEFPDFSDARVRQMVFPDVSVGDVLELKSTIEIKKPLIKGVFFTYFSYPLGMITQRSRLTINFPATMKPHYGVTLPSKKEPTVTQEGDRVTVEWAPDPIVLSRAHEPAIPPSFDVDPFVLFSTMESWNNLTSWYLPLFESTLKNPSPVIQDKVTELTKDAGEDREQIIKALHKYVSQEVEYIGIGLGETAWRPYPPEYVLNNRYGDCKGKAALLIAMLRTTGIDAYGVLMKLSDLGRLITDIPSNDFNHVIVAIPKKEGGYLYIDPTLPFAPYDFLTPFEENRQVIILDRVEPHFETTPDLPVEKSNRLHSKGTTKINVDGSMDSEGVLQYSGLRGMDFRNVIRHTNPSLLRDLMERGLKARYPQSKLESYELSDTQNVEEPFTFKVKGKLIGPVQVAGNLLLVDQSPSESVVGLASLVTFDQRIYPLFLGVGVMDSVEDVIIPPEGYIPKSIPENLSLIKPFGSYERHVEKQGNQLIWKVTFVVDQPVIPVEIYPEFKAFIEKISAAEQEKMVFEKPPTL